MKHLKIFLLGAIALIFAACSKNDSPTPPSATTRTILSYIVASNSLSDIADQDLLEMKAAVQANGLNNCRVLAYVVSRSHATPTLYEITLNNNTAALTELKTYDSKKGSSVTYQRVNQVIADMKSFAPANEYGLILWSHSNGWARNLDPKNTIQYSADVIPEPTVNDFGDDDGFSMPIPELARAIPDNTFNFICTDACYMGAVEIAYELRNKARYYIGSPTEVMGAGMPYNKVLPLFLAKEAKLKEVCSTTYQFYDQQSGVNRSCTIALYDLRAMSDFATICKDINQHPGSTITDKAVLQGYNFLKSSFLVDCLQYYSLRASQSQLDALNKAYANFVTTKYATPQFLGSQLTIYPAKYSGMSTYYPGSSNDENEAAYQELAWYNDVVK